MFEGLTPEQIALIAASLGMPKLLIKLLDVIQQGTGTISEPYFIRKKAEALVDGKTYEIRKLTEEFVESQKLLPSIEYKDGQLSIPNKSQNELSLQQRYENRFEHQQARKQLNVENVTSNAVEELLGDPEIETNTNQESVDPDWISIFFQTVENISDEQMQQLWGRILAGEVKRPRSFSLRTLEVLKNLSKTEAEIFIKFGNVILSNRLNYFVHTPKSFDYLQQRFGISYSDLLLLDEVGLIILNKSDLILDSIKKDTKAVFTYAKYAVLITFNQDTPKASFSAIWLTKIGEELFGLLEIDFDTEVLKWIVTPFLKHDVTVKYLKDFRFEDDNLVILGKVNQLL